MTISLIKLVNGEEILGSIISNDEYGIRVQDPLLISIERDFKTGLSGLTLVTYIPYADEKNIILNNNSVITFTEVDIYMTEYYEKSLQYNKKYHDKKYKHNINYAISQIDTILSDEPVKTKKKTEPANNVVYTSFNISSNTYN